MGSEIRNAASEATEAFLRMWGDRERVLREAHNWFADGFVRHDRRRLIAMPDADASVYLEQHLLWFEISDDVPRFEMMETIAVRGERHALGRMRVRYGSELAAEMLYVNQWDETIRQTQRLSILDSDDVAAAIEELDRFHCELQGEKNAR